MKAGDKFEFKGFEWVVLNPEVTEGGVLAMMTSTWNGKEYPFDENRRDNWKESSLKKKLEEELLPVLGKENLLDYTVDIEADNGDKKYGVDVCKVFILSCWEYRRYRDYVPRLGECMWTCTPWTTDGRSVRRVNPNGDLSFIFADATHGVAPACVIKRSSIAQTDAERLLECEKRIQELEDFLEETEELLDYVNISKEAEELVRVTGDYEKSVLQSYDERARKIREKSRELRGEKAWEE
nr:MAG TPA: hypothetical protein [Caudoviricetes sp.]